MRMRERILNLASSTHTAVHRSVGKGKFNEETNMDEKKTSMEQSSMGLNQLKKTGQI